MTLYFAGGEDTSFSLSGSFTLVGGGVTYRSAFCREAIGTTSGVVTTTAWPMTTSAATPQWGPSSSFYIHGQYYGNASSNTTASAILLALADSSGVGRILVRGTGTAGQVKISTRNAAGTIVDLVTSAAGALPAASSGNPVAIDLFVNYAVSGQCTLYANGVSIADTGAGINVTTDSATALGQTFYGAAITAGGGITVGWSECIAQSTTTLGMALWTLIPAATGNTQSWTPNTVANVNKGAINDTTFVSTGTAAVLSEWTTNITPPGGIWSVNAVVQEARVSIGTTGPQHFAWVLRTADGSDHTTGSLAPTTSFSNFNNQQWLTNPHTSAPWAVADITTGFNIGIESLA